MTKPGYIASAQRTRNEFRALREASAHFVVKAHRPAEQSATAPDILVIGPVRDLIRRGQPVPVMDGMVFADAVEVDAALIARIGPEVVLSGLFCGALDAVDIAESLIAARFKGRYRVVCEPLPHPGLVLSELRAAAPGLDIDLFTLPRH